MQPRIRTRAKPDLELARLKIAALLCSALGSLEAARSRSKARLDLARLPTDIDTRIQVSNLVRANWPTNRFCLQPKQIPSIDIDSKARDSSRLVMMTPPKRAKVSSTSRNRQPSQGSASLAVVSAAAASATRAPIFERRSSATLLACEQVNPSDSARGCECQRLPCCSQ